MNLLVATTAFALVLASGASVAQTQSRATEMQNVTVNGVPVPYETYAADLSAGFTLQALVGNAHTHYMQAKRAAEHSEALRKRGFASQPIVSVAIDNSAGAGVAKQIQLVNGARETIAIVNVYCKRSVPSGGPHCKLVPRQMGADTDGQRLASIQTGAFKLTEVQLRD
jgi:transcriptional regulator GlxA family with amidase domain